MYPAYHVFDLSCSQEVPAEILPATESDFRLTVQDCWQTSWMSKYLQEPFLQKYALKIAATGELVGLGAYRNMPEGFLVYIEYIESAPHSNPTLSKNRKYRGIGAALLAYGVQLSIDSGYGGTIYLKAKTSEIREHYIRDFGAIPFSHRAVSYTHLSDPYGDFSGLERAINCRRGRVPWPPPPAAGPRWSRGRRCPG